MSGPSTQYHVGGLPAPAKINLALQVGAPRADGYHPVATWCVHLDAGDRLGEGEETKGFALDVVGPRASELRGVRRNLIAVAAEAYLARRPGTRRHCFILRKHLPLASGVGGGTSNGAAALALMNARAAAPLPDDALLKTARGLGADGPICLAPLIGAGHSWIGEGLGDRVRRGPALPPLWMCLVTPPVAVPTGTIFRRYDEAGRFLPIPLHLPGRVATYRALRDLLEAHRNDLAGPAEAAFPMIAATRRRLSAQPGCIFARMSGSGATAFGLFASPTAAARAANGATADGAFVVHGRLFGQESV